jgi:soluble lytic murein transglycosylase
MIKKQKADKLTIAIIILAGLVILAVAALAVNIGYDKYLQRVHPVKYSEIVESLAEEYNLDKYLIYAVIKTESGFNPEAVSNAGAYGLMQIMPDTFSWLRDYRIEDDSAFEDMFIPESNIRYGAYLIAYHMRNYNDDLDCSMAAYHAGDGKVGEWLGNAEYSSDGKTLDVIPSSETAHYVNKINKAYETYLRLYKEN